MPKYNLERADLLLLLLFIAYCAAVLLRVHVEATGYTSPDSEYYLEAARSFKAGEKFMIRDLYGSDPNEYVYFTAWPIGYPALIAITSWISSLSLFWASKVLNLLFVAFGFLLLRFVCRPYAFVLASMYSTFSFLEIYSYTWSESVFLFGCLAFVYVIYRVHITGSIQLVYLLLVIAAFMFLNRYIGFFAGGVTLLLAIITRLEGRNRLSNHLFITFLLNVFLVWAYVLHNYYVAGYNTDSQRLTQHMESLPQVLLLAAKGILTELFLIRKFYFRGRPDTLTIFMAGVQIAVITFLWRLLQGQKSAVVKTIKQQKLSLVAILVACAYLFVLIFLRSISQFDAPDYRLLAPFSFLVLFAILNILVSLPDQLRGAKRAKYLVFSFFLLSLLFNLPKEFLLSHLKQLW